MVEHLRRAIREEMQRRPFVIDTIVIMPDHIHTLWTMPEDDADYSIPWRKMG
jgi:putative transposase